MINKNCMMVMITLLNCREQTLSAQGIWRKISPSRSGKSAGEFSAVR